MIPADLADQLRDEVRRLKDVQDQFLQTYERLCLHHGGPAWRNDKDVETVFHHVRREVIPVMEQAGMDHRAVQALCAWAERLLTHR
jgi:hypothetical protein